MILTRYYSKTGCVGLAMCCVKKTVTEWVKKCMEYEVEGAIPRGRPKRLGERLCKKTVRNVN